MCQVTKLYLLSTCKLVTCQAYLSEAVFRKEGRVWGSSGHSLMLCLFSCVPKPGCLADPPPAGPYPQPQLLEASTLLAQEIFWVLLEPRVH